jgi:hypothetical protein
VGGLNEPQIQSDGEQEVKALIVSPLQFPSDQLPGVSSCSHKKPVSSSPCAMKLEHDTVSAGVTTAPHRRVVSKWPVGYSVLSAGLQRHNAGRCWSGHAAVQRFVLLGGILLSVI